MKFEVIVTGPALTDATEYARFIRGRSHDEVASDAWWNGWVDAVFSLESLPARCPFIPEQTKFEIELRQFLYASHRIIFEITAEKVFILRVYHSAQRALTPSILYPRSKASKPA